MPLPYITEIKTVNDFRECLENNPGVFIIKFGADWCQPCKMIEKDVLNYFAKMPNTIQCAMIDVDDSIELYGFLKKRIVCTAKNKRINWFFLKKIQIKFSNIIRKIVIHKTFFNNRDKQGTGL